MSEALKIKFIKLKSALVMEVLEGTLSGLGLESGFDVISKMTKSPFVEISEALAGNVDFNVFTFRADLFNDLKDALTLFAENNALFGNEKPVPRIEYEGKNYRLFYRDIEKDVNSKQISRDEYLAWDDLRQNPDSTFPIYKDVPRFTHEWRKVTPTNIKKEDLPESILDKAERLDSSYRRGISDAIEFTNQLNTELPETWIFTLSDSQNGGQPE